MAEDFEEEKLRRKKVDALEERVRNLRNWDADQEQIDMYLRQLGEAAIEAG